MPAFLVSRSRLALAALPAVGLLPPRLSELSERDRLVALGWTEGERVRVRVRRAGPEERAVFSTDCGVQGPSPPL